MFPLLSRGARRRATEPRAGHGVHDSPVRDALNRSASSDQPLHTSHPPVRDFEAFLIVGGVPADVVRHARRIGDSPPNLWVCKAAPLLS
jgi:hypothetical protein